MSNSPPQPAEARKREILGLIILGAGLLLLTGLVADAGSVQFLRTLTGIGAIPIAATLALAGAYLTLRRALAGRLSGEWYRESLLGMQLLFLAGLIGAHLRLGAGDFLAAQAGKGGGLIGWALAAVLARNLGPLIAWAVVFACAAIGLILVFSYTPLRQLRLPGVRAPRISLPDLHALLPSSSRQPPVSAARKPDAPTANTRPPAGAKRKPAPPTTTGRPSAGAGRKPSTPTTSSRPPQAKEKAARLGRRSRKLPPLDLLHGEDRGGSSEEQAQIQAKIIEDTLGSFGIPVKVQEINVGPTVTQFGVVPGSFQRGGRTVRVRVNKIVALADDLSLALAASPVRIEAPVPGRPYLGIEVPNPDSTLVSLRRVLQDRNFRKIRSPLALPVGRDVSGQVVAIDLRRLPHLLIAGATGSGKSVALNAMICALLFSNTPAEVHLILVDPKRVELPGYNGIPHLVAPVVVDADHANGALSWLLVQMDERYRRFADAGVRDLAAFNSAAPAAERLPYLIMIVDELADLMVTAPDSIEAKLVRLAQMARATGIHLIVATQRPSVDVVTGLIKANFPARLAFSVTSQVDSRVILDTPGADKLLGRGDGLLMTPESAKLQRIQGCFVSDGEISALVKWWKKNHPTSVSDPTRPRYPWSQMMVEEATASDVFHQAVDALRGRQRITTSGLQRLLNIGYPRAARLMEEMEKAGIVGPEEDRRSGRLVLLEEED